MEKSKAGRRRMVGMWGGKGEEDVCWESWTVRVTVAEPKTDSGEFSVEINLVSPEDKTCLLPGYLLPGYLLLTEQEDKQQSCH